MGESTVGGFAWGNRILVDSLGGIKVLWIRLGESTVGGFAWGNQVRVRLGESIDCFGIDRVGIDRLDMESCGDSVEWDRSLGAAAIRWISGIAIL